MMPPSTPVLVTWPGVDMTKGEITAGAPDGSVYQVTTTCGCSVIVIEAALTDLRQFPGVPLSAFAKAGWA